MVYGWLLISLENNMSPLLIDYLTTGWVSSIQHDYIIIYHPSKSVISLFAYRKVLCLWEPSGSSVRNDTYYLLRFKNRNPAEIPLEA